MTDQNATSSPVLAAHALGHSIWLEHIDRHVPQERLRSMIDGGQFLGLTISPERFEQVMSDTDAYDDAIAAIVSAAPQISATELFKRLAIADVQDAADALSWIYHQSAGAEGYFSMPVHPTVSRDAAASVALAVDLHKHLDRPNLLLSLPGTHEGLKAFEALTTLGINVNVTQVYTVARYRLVAHAYIRGLERRLSDDMPVDHLCSVVSFGIDPIVQHVKKALPDNGGKHVAELPGRIAIANARVAYGHFVNLFGSEAFSRLQQAGARPQRLLWSDIDSQATPEAGLSRLHALIGPDTISALSHETLQAFIERGVAEAHLTHDLASAHADISTLGDLGISLVEAGDELEQSAVTASQTAFTRLLAVLTDKRKQVLN